MGSSRGIGKLPLACRFDALLGGESSAFGDFALLRCLKKGTYTAPASNLACRFLMKKWLIVSLRNVCTPYRTPYDEGGMELHLSGTESICPKALELIPKALV